MARLSRGPDGTWHHASRSNSAPSPSPVPPLRRGHGRRSRRPAVRAPPVPVPAPVPMPAPAGGPIAVHGGAGAHDAVGPVVVFYPVDQVWQPGERMARLMSLPGRVVTIQTTTTSSPVERGYGGGPHHHHGSARHAPPRCFRCGRVGHVAARCPGLM